MKRRRFCWLGRWMILGMVLSPVLTWVLIVLVAPTNWARRHIVAAIAKSSGRSVEIDSLSICLGGNVQLSGLRIAAPGNDGDPWLDASRVQLDVGPCQLLLGRFEPSYLEVDDATLRVLRRSDGSFEIAEAKHPGRNQATHAGGDPSSCAPARLEAKLRGIHLEVVDEPDRTVLSLRDVSGEGTWDRETGLTANLSGLWSEGPFQLTAHLGQEDEKPSFEGELRATDVILDERMNLLTYAVPVLAGSKNQLQGRLAMDVYLRGRGSNASEVAKSLIGHGHVAIDPINLDGTPFMIELGKLLQAPISEKSASVSTDFTIQSSRITTERLELAAGRLPIVFSGWTDFAGRLDYTVRIDGLPDRVPEKALRLIQRLDLDLKELTTVKLTGDLGQVQIRVHAGDGSLKPLQQLVAPEDRERFRQLGRQFRDKVMR